MGGHEKGPIPVFQVFTHAIWAPTVLFISLSGGCFQILDVVITFSFLLGWWRCKGGFQCF
jgi:hypothetical protein